jgi:hypothetical protein
MLFNKANGEKEVKIMRWLETIKVQSATAKEKTTENQLAILLREILKNTDRQGLSAATVSSHVSVPGYFALRLLWDTGDLQPRGSLLGMSLAQSLKTFGLVDHSVWIECSKITGGKNNVQ